jgi:lysophospholipase L1-like esterase
MKQRLLLLALLILSSISFAQIPPRFAEDVATIKSYDKIYAIPDNPIVFVGSSSIRKWETLPLTFGSYNVINRGIGGAVVEDIIYHLDDLVIKYKPRQIVLYVGENNLPNEKDTPDSIVKKTAILIRGIRVKLPDVPIIYIALKPSPVRDKFQQKCMETNKLIRDLVVKEHNISFVDIYTPMLKNGKSRPELFVEDMLHMNGAGYAIWEKLVKPLLKK